jgi:thioesterase domain-containing protein
VHSSTGGVTEYAELAGHLETGQQFFGLQSRGMTGDGRPLESVKEMAGTYLPDVLAVQRDGPYLLAGWSMGAYIAVEMARQLTTMGKQVGGVFLIGPPYSELPKRRRQPFDQATRKLLRNLDDAIGAQPGTRLLPRYEDQLLELWDLEEDGQAAVRAGDKQQLRMGRVALINHWAGIHHLNLMRRDLEPYDGRVVLFMPQDDDAGIQLMTAGQWRSALGREPELVPVPGQHKTVINGQGAAVVGAWLRAEIARWQRGEGALR